MTRARLPLVLLGVLGFGLLAGFVHGNDAGLRAEFGNLSAPWLVVALVPAWWAGSALRGLVLGTGATMVALVGFYVALTAEMYGHLGTVHGIVHSFTFVLAANRIWFVAGLMSGPLCGLAAGFLGTRLRPTWLLAGVGVLLIGEIAVVSAVAGTELPVLHLRWAMSDRLGYEIEAAAGVLLLAALAVTTPRRARAR